MLSSLAAMCATEGSTHAVWGELAISTLQRLNFPEADPGEASPQGWAGACSWPAGCWELAVLVLPVLSVWRGWSQCLCSA